MKGDGTMKHPGGRPRRELALKADDIPQQAYFTVKEAAELTGAHIHTIQARLRSGELRGKKLGKEWRIYRDSLIQVME